MTDVHRLLYFLCRLSTKFTHSPTVCMYSWEGLNVGRPFRTRTLWRPLHESQNIWRRVTALTQQRQEPAHRHLASRPVQRAAVGLTWGADTPHPSNGQATSTSNDRYQSYLHYKALLSYESMLTEGFYKLHYCSTLTEENFKTQSEWSLGHHNRE